MPTAPAPVHARMSSADWGLLLLLSLLWGGSFFFNAVAVRALPPLTVVTVRVGLTALILAALLAGLGRGLPRGRRVWGPFLVMGLLNNAVPFSLIVWAQSHIVSGVAAILNASTPLFGVLLAHRLTADERLTPARLGGVLAGLAGVAVMMGAAAARALGVDLLAQVACLAAACSYALASHYGRRFRALGLPPLATAFGQVAASTAILVPLTLAVDRPWTLPAPSAGVTAALIGLAAVSTAPAYVIYFRLLRSAGATNLLLVTFLVPVSAILLGVVVLGERLLPQHLAGMALIGLGLAILDGRPLGWLRRRQPGRKPAALVGRWSGVRRRGR